MIWCLRTTTAGHRKQPSTDAPTGSYGNAHGKGSGNAHGKGSGNGREWRGEQEESRTNNIMIVERTAVHPRGPADSQLASEPLRL